MNAPLRLLLVDDDEDDFQLTRALLAKIAGPPPRLEWCDTFDGGRQKLLGGDFDLCLLDFRLGARTGVELLRDAQEAGCRIPVILLTGNGDREVDLEAMHAGAVDYLDKSLLTPAQLERAIRYAVERARNAQSLRLFRAVVKQVGEAVIVARVDTRGQLAIVHVNPAFSKITGLEREEALGRGLEVITGADHDPERIDELLQQVLRGETITTELVGRRKDGKRLELELHLAPIRDEHAEITHVGAIVRDVTGPHELKARLLVSDRLATVGTLAAGVAHEMNNPLSYALSSIKFVRDEIPAAKSAWPPETYSEVVEALDSALDGATRLKDIVGDLKSFSHIDRSDRREPVNLNRAVQTAVRLTGTEIRHRGTLQLALGAVPDVEANEGRLTQVFVNLLVNAAYALERAAGEERRVTVRTFTEGAWVVAEVEDTGCGIPESVRPSLFRPFFTTKPPGVGTGLGLSIGLSTVAELGGSLTFTSEVGRGTTFRVQLPAAGPG